MTQISVKEEAELIKLAKVIQFRTKILIFIDTPRRILRKYIKWVCEKEFR